MTEDVKVDENITPEMLNVLHRKLNQYHGAITEVAKEVGFTYRSVLKTLQNDGKSINYKIVAAAYIVLERHETLRRQATRLQQQFQRAENEFYAEQSEAFNQNNQQVMKVLNR